MHPLGNLMKNKYPCLWTPSKSAAEIVTNRNLIDMEFMNGAVTVTAALVDARLTKCYLLILEVNKVNDVLYILSYCKY